MSYNSTGFSFKNKQETINKDINNNLTKLLNIKSITDFIGKKDPLEKQKQLYEDMQEEKMKIKKRN